MDVQRIGIVGSGQMGGGIGEVAARSGYEVVLRSRTAEAVAATIAGIDKSLARQVAKGKLDDDEREAMWPASPLPPTWPTCSTATW